MKRSLLYVDDEKHNLTVLKANLKGDFRVVLAESGETALELMKQEFFPVIIADQRMPGMTGVQFFEIVRSLYPTTKRIILTGYSDPEAILDAINKSQIYYFLEKPWEYHHMMSVLTRAYEAYELESSNQALQDQLAIADRFKILGRAAAEITHEMKNQLCIIPLLEVIEDNYPEHEDLIQIAQIGKRVHHRLESLLNEISAFGKATTHMTSTAPVSMAKMVHELVRMLQYDEEIPANRIFVQITHDVYVDGSEPKLQQVLVNLIRNALYATRQKQDGKIVILVDQEERQAVLSVTDNGVGISAENLERIWEPLFTTKGQEGHGLGLDICRRIVENHRGKITCRSREGHGTTFLVHLPLLEIPVKPDHGSFRSYSTPVS